jgi:hypothetical protein
MYNSFWRIFTMADKSEFIDKLLTDMEIIVVPSEFISAACITYFNGKERYVSVDEITNIMQRGPVEEQGIYSVKAVINLDLVKETIEETAENILKNARL